MIVLGWWDESSGKNACCTILITRVHFPIPLVEREPPLWRCSPISTQTHTRTHKYSHMLTHASENYNFRDKNFNVILFKEFIKHEQGFYSVLVVRTEEITFCKYKQKSILKTLQTFCKSLLIPDPGKEHKHFDFVLLKLHSSSQHWIKPALFSAREVSNLSESNVKDWDNTQGIKRDEFVWKGTRNWCRQCV